MDINTITKKLKRVLSEKKLNRLGKTTGFTQRERNVTAFQLVTSMICALGEKQTVYLSDISRYYNQLTGQQVRYKPFHNQLSKPALAELMKVVADKVFGHWINTVLKYQKAHFTEFEQIIIQDGSSFSVKDELDSVWPGRFTQVSPAAIELHAVLNLASGSFEQVTLTPDSYSERAQIPPVETLKNTLYLADRGYYSGAFIKRLDEAGGYYVLRAKGLKRVLISYAVREDSKVLLKQKPVELAKLQPRLPKHQAVDMDVTIEGETFRLIALWSLKEKRHTYLVTNLKRATYTAQAISQIYRMRWQIEILFKECKSYSSLRGFNTRNAYLQESLIWASLISVTLKRFITGCFEQLYQIELSTLVVAKTTVSWWFDMLEAIVQKRRKGLVNCLSQAGEFLKENARRAHLKRDRQTGIFQYGLESAFYSDF